MPEVFDRFFQAIGFRREDFYGLRKLDPSFEVVTDSARIKVKPDAGGANRATLDSLEEGGYSKFMRYLRECSEIYRKTMSSLLYRPYSGMRSMLSPSVLRAALGMRLFSSMQEMNSSYFSSREMLYLTGFSSVFLGGDPSSIPAVYSMVNASIFGDGVFYPPEGGFASVVGALAKAGQRLGVKFVTGEEIVGIRASGSRVTAVEGGDHETYWGGDLFVFNADYHHVEQDLLEPGLRSYSDAYWASRDVSPSALIAYIGLSGKLGLNHHTIVIKGDWEEHFQSIRKRSSGIPEDFAFYASARSKSDPSVAPQGCENLFLLIPVSVNFQESDTNRERTVQRALERLEEITGEGIRQRIVYMKTYCRRDFEKDYNAFLGSAFGLSQTLGQTAGLRPAMRSRKLRNMFYAGQYTHPGIGVPMTLISAQVLGSLISGSSYWPQKPALRTGTLRRRRRQLRS